MEGPKANCRFETHQSTVAPFAPPGSDSIASPMEKVPCNALPGRKRKVLVCTLGGFLTRIVTPPCTEYRIRPAFCLDGFLPIADTLGDAVETLPAIGFQGGAGWVR